MNIKRFLVSVAAADTIGLGTFSAQAAVICNGCN